MVTITEELKNKILDFLIQNIGETYDEKELDEIIDELIKETESTI